MTTIREARFLDDDGGLIYIYKILRLLKGKNVRLFSKRYLLKLIDERLIKLETFADVLVAKLFKRLAKKSGNKLTTLRSGEFTTKCAELDEYFHLSLYYLHDFVIELDWHEPVIEDLHEEDLAYIRARLKQIDIFLQSREVLSSNMAVKKSLDGMAPKSVKSPSRKVKSNLSMRSSRVDSPTRKRRIRFQDSSPKNEPIRQQDIQDSHSILALDLLIYSLNIFVTKVRALVDQVGA